MWGIISTAFLIFYCLMGLYIGFKGWTVISKSDSYFKKVVYWMVFLILVLSFPISELGESFLPEGASLMLTLWGGYSMVAVSYLFILILFIDLFRLIDKGIGFIPVNIRGHKKTPQILGVLVIILVIAVLTYGGYNARSPVVREYVISVDKKTSQLQQLHIAMVSDIHFGKIIDAGRLDNLVLTISILQPDILLLAGDITDGMLRPEDAKKLADILGKLHAKYGIYAVPGNHDRNLREDNSELSRYFRESGIHVLKDKYLKIHESFYIIGRDDIGRRNGDGRKAVGDLINGIDSSLPMIMLDHQPVDIKNAHDSGVDLQLSGHTHSGQIFPINFITGQMYEMDWGLLKKDKYNLIVSSGYGTWGPPLRIGNNPEVVSVKMRFN